MDDPDLETARFEILDFSCPGPKQPRILRLIDARDIPRIDEARKKEMLETFAEGYFRAVAALTDEPPSARDESGDEAPEADSDQPGLYD
jgi:hypothetical protein